MQLAGFETAIPATKQPKTYALDRAASGIGNKQRLFPVKSNSNLIL
jgi:hypothetical protein